MRPAPWISKDTDGVTRRCVACCRNTASNDGIQEPGAIQVQGQIVLAGGGAHRFQLFNGPDGAAAHIVSVFKRGEPAAWEVGHIRSNGGFELIRLKQASVSGNGPDHGARVKSRSTRFKVNRMRTLFHDNFFAGARVDLKSNLI